MAFQSWLLRWNAFALENLRLNVNTLDLVAAHVAVARFRLETRAVTFDRYTQIGFVGTVTYHIIKTRLKALLQPSKTLLETDRIAEGAKNRLRAFYPAEATSRQIKKRLNILTHSPRLRATAPWRIIHGPRAADGNSEVFSPSHETL